MGLGHLKVVDASWHEERSLVRLFTGLGLLGSGPKAMDIGATYYPEDIRSGIVGLSRLLHEFTF